MWAATLSSAAAAPHRLRLGKGQRAKVQGFAMLKTGLRFRGPRFGAVLCLGAIQELEKGGSKKSKKHRYIERTS